MKGGGIKAFFRPIARASHPAAQSTPEAADDGPVSETAPAAPLTDATVASDDDDDAGFLQHSVPVNSFELEREERIRRNHEYMQQLGLVGAVSVTPTTRPAAKRKKPQSASLPAQLPKRSGLRSQQDSAVEQHPDSTPVTHYPRHCTPCILRLTASSASACHTTRPKTADAAL